MQAPATVIYVILAFMCVFTTGFPQNIPVPLGNYAEALDKLEMKNYDGTSFYFSSYKRHKLSIFLVLAHDCPICQKYGAKFREIAEKYGGDVQVVGIAPADGATDENIADFAQTYRFNFPIVIDSDKAFVHIFNGKVTPEVFLVDRTGELLYRGKIDNWFYELGKYRNVVTEHYLDDAIAATLSGEPVKVNKTEPVGCMLNMRMKH